jgi:hypothetical protein
MALRRRGSACGLPLLNRRPSAATGRKSECPSERVSKAAKLQLPNSGHRASRSAPTTMVSLMGTRARRVEQDEPEGGLLEI